MLAKQFIPATLLTLFLGLVLGILFPFVISVFAQTLFPYQANGSFVEHKGQIIGSELIGQRFASPGYFHTRPSAAGAGYDPLASGGTNLGPTSRKLISGLDDNPETTETDESYPGVEDLAKEYRLVNNLPANTVLPADAVTRSGSGLDPHISLENARLQSGRIAKERGVPVEKIRALIQRETEMRFLGIFGEPRVNVLKLNLALDN